MKRIVSLLMLSLMLTFSLSYMLIPTHADVFTDEEIADLGTGVTTDTLDDFIVNSQSEMWMSALIDASGASGGDTITIGSNSYTLRAGVSTEYFKRQVLNQYKSSKVTEDTVALTDGINVTADTSAAMQALSGFIPYVNMLLGIIVTLITLGLAVFTSFDVCYIVFPVFRNKCEQQKMQGSGAMVKQTANGGTKLRWVSDEAQYAVEHQTLEQGGNPLTSYLKNRVLAYVFVAVILFILLTGNISIITNLALKAVAGIMTALQGLSG